MKFSIKDIDLNDTLGWLLTNAMANVKNKEVNDFNKLREVTNSWNDVELTMQLNGIEVDPKGIIEMLLHEARQTARAEAKEKVDEVLNAFDLSEMIELLNRTVLEKTKEMTPEYMWADYEN